MKKLLAKKGVFYITDCPYIIHKSGKGVKYHPKVGSAFCKKCQHFRDITEINEQAYVMCVADEARREIL
jgi:hypothetical protein